MPVQACNGIIYLVTRQRGRDSSVGIATRYGLDGRGIESQWVRDLPHPSRPALGGPSTLLYNGWRVSFPWVKRPECGVDHPLPSLPRLKEE